MPLPSHGRGRWFNPSRAHHLFNKLALKRLTEFVIGNHMATARAYSSLFWPLIASMPEMAKSVHRQEFVKTCIGRPAPKIFRQLANGLNGDEWVITDSRFSRAT